MKTLILLGTLLAQLSFADTLPIEETVQIERSRAEFSIEIELNKNTVRCLVGDYGARSLKISMPELIGRTAFRHTTSGETLPCINAGFCSPFWDPNESGLKPEDILDEARPTEVIAVLVVLNERLSLNHQNKTCSRFLIEDVSSPVRGLDFRHQDWVSLGLTDYEACLKLKEAAAQ